MANPYFNAAYYLAHNADVAAAVAGMTPAQQLAVAEQHYDLHGATEGRAPNAWFDATAYLNANPDLVPGGVTLATALAHYAQFGESEGRTFSNAPALNPANFDASAYAVANPDVAKAFNITDTTNLTSVQKADLLSHFLAHGISEGRAGAGAQFEALVAASAIVIDAPYLAAHNNLAVGTVANDMFLAAGSLMTSAVSVNGSLGTDTLHITGLNSIAAPDLASVENVIADVTVGATAGLGALGSSGVHGVQALTVNGNAALGNSFTYTGDLLHSLTVDGGPITAAFGATSVAGTADALTANLTATTSLTINGVETVNATLGTGTYSITDSGVQGSALTFNVAGGTAATGSTLTLNGTGSAHLASVTVDASTFAGDLTVNDIGALGQVGTTSITTGAGADHVNLTLSAGATTATVTTGAGIDNVAIISAAGQTVTVDLGAGNDFVSAGAGHDVLTGGAGADTFTFATGTAVVQTTTTTSGVISVSTHDVITDFTGGASADGLDVADMVHVQAAGALGTLGTVNASGVLSIATNGYTLQSVLTSLATTMTAADTGVLFEVDGNAYLFVSDGAAGLSNADSLIEMTGVDATHLTATVGHVAIA